MSNMCGLVVDRASLQLDTNIANTRTGAGSQSRAVARFVSRRRATFKEAVAGFLEFVQIAMRGGRSGLAAMRR